ncbi:MAG: zinc-dependent metalloprotease [Sphingobacteriales bacterium 50-39]|nr:zinc-dependent metalloprotease [Sphingobacteriales bacterium]OJW53030.1 MAG: zinc-dependent metalloprotease [Sphingobacteriales bacterium 50-39]
MIVRKNALTTLVLSLSFTLAIAQRPATPPATPGANPAAAAARPSAPAKQEPKPYKEVITDKAVSQTGLFTVHRIEDKWYFEIPDSILSRDILVSTRYGKTAAGSSYGGEMVNLQTIHWEKGPSNTLFLRVLTIVSVATDSTQPIAMAVSNSNMNPIAAAFDIKAYGKGSDSSGTTVIDVTDFFKGDNQAVSLNPGIKRRFNLSGLAADRSYIASIHTYPINTEIKTVKTFASTPTPGGFAAGPFPSTTLPAAEVTGAVTLELNNSFLLLPKTPMRKRLFDSRVGYFASEYTMYGDDQQRVEISTFIHRWRLEPKDEDIEKWKRGELVEPKKQIVYYIDPATPKKWRPYLIAGINDWQAAFEKAGFKNAIVGKEWPENDKTMSLEDARFSVIRYFASDIENAYGPNVADPRSGEILESHIGWYHNVMKLVHDWYFIQASISDPRARKMKFDDALMGDLIRFVSSHEVGHTLGLRHNMGSSSKTPVELLRNKAWVEANGHTASIMDYARFNYVAQPEDNIGPRGLYPRIGDYDKWAILWGYKGIDGTKDEEEDKKILNKWAIDSLRSNPRLWFGGEGFNFDPRAQTEDLSDNSMKAGEYGIKNLKRILPQLPEWTKEEADQYDNLEEMYSALVGQFGRYMGHVVKNVGGIYETFKSIEQPGDIYEPTPKATQKEAMDFLSKQLFTTPAWLLNKDILNKFSNPAATEAVGTVQANVLNSLLSGGRLFRMSVCTGRYGAANVYGPDEMLADAKRAVWSELATGAPIDIYRRSLQKTYVEALINLINPPPPSPAPAGLPRQFAALFFSGNLKNTDVPSIARAQMNELRTEILAAVPRTTDKLSKYHLQDIAERIKQALNPSK